MRKERTEHTGTGKLRAKWGINEEREKGWMILKFVTTYVFPKA